MNRQRPLDWKRPVLSTQLAASRAIHCTSGVSKKLSRQPPEKTPGALRAVDDRQAETLLSHVKTPLQLPPADNQTPRLIWLEMQSTPGCVPPPESASFSNNSPEAQPLPRYAGRKLARQCE